MLRVAMAFPVERDTPGDWYVALIIGDEEITQAKVTGSDVIGMNDDDKLAAGSVICTPGTNFVAYRDETFTQRS